MHHSKRFVYTFTWAHSSMNAQTIMDTSTDTRRSKPKYSLRNFPTEINTDTNTDTNTDKNTEMNTDANTETNTDTDTNTQTHVRGWGWG